MRRLVLSLALLFLVTLAGGAAADCNSPSGGPFFCCGGYTWYEYSDNSCLSIDSGIATTTLSCYSTPGWAYTGFSQHITRAININDAGSTHWEVSFNADLIDPHQSWWNQIDARIYVYHPASGTTSYQLYYHNGTQGDVSCATPYLDFTAQQGDSISIDFMGSSGWSDSLVKIGNIHIYRITP